ncbi:MAG TPA: HlyD family efflux transporter periplasmic adaptor subunit, partial [Methylibium sp.]|nr:HlyD family efflux transporter periplasmic adaptor subunit [Methylibium sp.]
GLWPVTSPVAGQVVRLLHDSATAVQAGEALMEVADTAQLEAVIDVLSADALRVKPGAPVRLALGSGLPELPARVARIEPVAFTKVSALGIEEQRVNLVIAPTAAAPVPLGDGYRVDAHITLEVRDDALLIPTGALLRDGSAWAVLVMHDGRAQRRAVEVAGRNGDWAWLRGGLQPGERVLLYPGAAIADGQRIRERRSPP